VLLCPPPPHTPNPPQCKSSALIPGATSSPTIGCWLPTALVSFPVSLHHARGYSPLPALGGCWNTAVSSRLVSRWHSAKRSPRLQPGTSHGRWVAPEVPHSGHLYTLCDPRLGGDRLKLCLQGQAYACLQNRASVPAAHHCAIVPLILGCPPAGGGEEQGGEAEGHAGASAV